MGHLVRINEIQFIDMLTSVGLSIFAKEEIFNKCDIRGKPDCMLDYREITLFLVLSKFFSVEEIIKYFVFPLLDTDGSKVIDEKELTSAIGRLILGVSDSEHEGAQETELDNTSNTQLLHGLFSLIDINDSKGIDAGELYSFYRTPGALGDCHLRQVHDFLFRLLGVDEASAAAAEEGGGRGAAFATGAGAEKI